VAISSSSFVCIELIPRVITLDMSDENPKFSRGRKMDIPPGTGFCFYVGGSPPGGITRYLVSGADGLKAENIIKLFEALKGRKATRTEIANVERKLKAEPADSSKAMSPEPKPAATTRKSLPTTRWGRPSSVSPGTEFGLSGITSQGSKKPEKNETYF
jgi:hypothetical protein